MASVARQGAVSILPGGAGDAADVERLSSTAFDPAFREAWSARQLLQVLDAPGGWLLLARSGPEGPDSPDSPESIVGFALLRMAGDEAELLLCATLQSVRRQGIARRLVEAALVSARARGALRMFLEVRESNHAARALYERCGFSQIGIRPGYYTSVQGERLAALTMSRLLL